MDMTDCTPLRLDHAVSKAFPHGGMTVAGLRREALRGRLSIWRIANKDFTSLSAIREMMEKCRVDCSPPNSYSAKPMRTGAQYGSSTTNGAGIALACGESNRKGAQEALERFLAKLRIDEGLPSSAPASAVFVADALTLYLTEKQFEVARPKELATRIDALLDHWGEKTLAEVNEDSCRQYAATRSTPTAARRELEDLRAAISMSIRKGICREIVKVTLPPKPKGRVRFLTRDEVARLLWTAWKRKEIQRGDDTAKYTTRHVARYILAALYTGSRSARVCRASFYPEEGRPFFDLDAGIFYRMSPDEKIRPNKRAPPIRIPQRLLAHLKRWNELGQRYPVEYNRKPADPKKAFRVTVQRAGLSNDIVRHTFRHTTVTWLMQAGLDKYQVAGFTGMSEKILDEVYGHHHPDHQTVISDAFTTGQAGRTKR